MTSIHEQLISVAPSLSEPLLRRLMVEDSLGYLRTDDTIIGFEINLEKTKPLSGFSLIAIKKQTLLTYKEDVDKNPTLIIFPPLDKLFDPEFDLLNLTVTKREISDASFKGKSLGSGLLKDLVKELIPPVRSVELPQGLSESIISRMLEINEKLARQERQTLEINKPKSRKVEKVIGVGNGVKVKPNQNQSSKIEPGLEHVNGKTFEDLVADLNNQTFKDLTSLSNHMILTYAYPDTVISQITMTTLENSTNPKQQINLAIMLYTKIYKRIRNGEFS